MRAKRRDRRVLAEIEAELSRDDGLQQSFQETSWSDDQRQSGTTLLAGLVLNPTSFWQAWVVSIVLQLGVVAGCALAAATRQVLLVILVLIAYPFALTPLVMWSKLHQEPEDHWW